MIRNPRLSIGRWTFAAVGVPALAVLVPHAFGAGLLHGLSIGQLLIFVTMTWAAVQLSILVAAGLDRVVTLFFWLYVYLFLGLAPLVQLEKDTFPLSGSYTEAQLVEGAVIVLVGITSYTVGRSHFLQGRNRFRGPVERFVARRVLHRRVHALGLLGIATSILLIPRIGGLNSILSSRQRLNEALGRESTLDYGNNAGSALVLAALTVPVFLALVLAFGSRAQLGRQFGRMYPVAWVVLIVTANAVFNNPLPHSRFWFGSVAVGVACLALPIARRNVFSGFAVAVIVALIVVFPYADRFRYESENVRKSDLELSATLTENLDHDSFQEFGNGIQYVEENGFTMGRQLLGVATFWVPRSIWADKPLDTGPLVAQHHGYTLENISAPLWMEGYLNFGVLGTAAFLFAFARLSDSVERVWLGRRRGTDAVPAPLVAVVIPTFAAYQMIILRGPLLQSVGRPALAVVLLLLCSSATPNRRESTAPGLRPPLGGSSYLSAQTP